MGIFTSDIIKFTGRQTASINNKGCLITLETHNGTINIQFDKEALDKIRSITHEPNDKEFIQQLQGDNKFTVVFE